MWNADFVYYEKQAQQGSTSLPTDIHLYINVLLTGKDHVCRFVGCGRNDRFNYVVMELQVGFYLPVSVSEVFCLLLHHKCNMLNTDFLC